jgi:hypothetical protein
MYAREKRAKNKAKELKELNFEQQQASLAEMRTRYPEFADRVESYL